MPEPRPNRIFGYADDRLGALEAGLDGPGIRRLAALESPTYFEVRDVLPRAMHDGNVSLRREEAALRLARQRAKEILESGDDPLKHTWDFERLWIDAGYPDKLESVGNLYDEVYIASSNLSDPRFAHLSFNDFQS